MKFYGTYIALIALLLVSFQSFALEPISLPEAVNSTSAMKKVVTANRTVTDPDGSVHWVITAKWDKSFLGAVVHFCSQTRLEDYLKALTDRTVYDAFMAHGYTWIWDSTEIPVDIDPWYQKTLYVLSTDLTATERKAMAMWHLATARTGIKGPYPALKYRS